MTHEEIEMLKRLASKEHRSDVIRALEEMEARVASDRPALTFEQALRELINRYCRENESGTPDFVLADFMAMSLKIFEHATRTRDKWHGIKLERFVRPSIEPERERVRRDFETPVTTEAIDAAARPLPAGWKSVPSKAYLEHHEHETAKAYVDDEEDRMPAYAMRRVCADGRPDDGPEAYVARASGNVFYAASLIEAMNLAVPERTGP